jgi:copper homeostasis protein (lipoprotein)
MPVEAPVTTTVRMVTEPYQTDNEGMTRVLLAALVITAAVPQAQVQQVLIGEYEGLGPCGDCPGLRTRLAVSAPRSSTPPQTGTFVLTETYEGKNVTNTTTGTWKLMRGTPTDKQAVVYQLTADKVKRVEYWLRVTDTELRSLDSKRQALPGPGSVTIRRMTLAPAALPGGYRAISADDMRVQMAAAFAAGRQMEKTPGMSMQKITRAEYQVVAGTNFRLCVTVNRNGTSETAQTVVFEDLKGAMSMTSWTWGPCAP